MWPYTVDVEVEELDRWSLLAAYPSVFTNMKADQREREEREILGARAQYRTIVPTVKTP